MTNREGSLHVSAREGEGRQTDRKANRDTVGEEGEDRENGCVGGKQK